MAKYIVKATHTGNQIRFSLPKGIIEEMRWEKISYLVLEQIDDHTIYIRKVLLSEEMD